MPTLTLKLTKGKDITKEIARFSQEKQAEVQKILNITAINVERNAKKNLTENGNVDTGRLRSSIRIQFFKNAKAMGYTIYTDVFYSVFIEFGTGIFAAKGNGRKTPWVYKDPATKQFVYTRGSKAYPFFYPAYRKEKAELKKRFKELWGKV